MIFCSVWRGGVRRDVCGEGGKRSMTLQPFVAVKVGGIRGKRGRALFRPFACGSLTLLSSNVITVGVVGGVTLFDNASGLQYTCRHPRVSYYRCFLPALFVVLLPNKQHCSTSNDPVRLFSSILERPKTTCQDLRWPALAIENRRTERRCI